MPEDVWESVKDSYQDRLDLLEEKRGEEDEGEKRQRIIQQLKEMKTVQRERYVEAKKLRDARLRALVVKPQVTQESEAEKRQRKRQARSNRKRAAEEFKERNEHENPVAQEGRVEEKTETPKPPSPRAFTPPLLGAFSPSAGEEREPDLDYVYQFERSSLAPGRPKGMARSAEDIMKSPLSEHEELRQKAMRYSISILFFFYSFLVLRLAGVVALSLALMLALSFGVPLMCLSVILSIAF